MAKSNPELIDALRSTAQRLNEGAHYEWGHMGRCNCGHLIQTITHLSDREIVQAADHRLDEWTEHAKDYCDGTSHSLDTLFLTLQEMGFDYQDVIHLENLSDQHVLQRLDAERRYLRRNCREDVTLYMNTLASMLEEAVVVVR